MNNTIKISVIIPVYNTEKYLRECIDSILCQSLKELEIILVDDGSNDGSWNIIQEYVDKYTKVSAYQQDRKRQGAARNLGLKHAKGEFVAFCDSDDTVPQHAYREMYELAVANNSEMVVGVHQSFNKIRKWIGVDVQRQYLEMGITNVSVNEFPELLFDASSCNRLIRITMLRNNGILFPTDGAGEDAGFMINVHLACSKITIFPKIIYNYRATEGSRSQRLSSDYFIDKVNITIKSKEIFELRNHPELYIYSVSAELKRLVGNRFERMVNELDFNSQLMVFDNLERLIKEADSYSQLFRRNFSSREKMRVLLLKNREFDALIALEKEPFSKKFVDLIGDEDFKEIVKHLMYFNEEKAGIKTLLRRKIKNKIKSIEKFYSIKNYKIVIEYILLFPFIKAKYIFLNNKSTWLFDERHSTAAEDNAYCLFQYILKNKKDIDAYYILNKNSKKWLELSSNKNIIGLYSIQHIIKLIQAKVLLSTDSMKYLALSNFKLLKTLNGKHKVFLQHGVTAYKRNTYTKTQYPYFDQITVASKIERDFYVKTNGFDSNDISITGLSRFDNLNSIDKKNVVQKKILVAPTWRKWLKNGDVLHSSKYFYMWKELLTDSRLLDILKKNEVTLIFRPHFNMLQFINEFSNNNENIIISKDPNMNLQDIIKECDLLVTDYSSIIFDFLYQNKPSISYIFDQTEMEAVHGKPYLPYNDLPAELTSNLNDCINSIEYYINNNMKLRSDPEINDFFEYRDNNNCERIYQSILKNL